MRIARIKIRVDSPGRWGKSLGRERNFEEVCLSLEQKKACLPSDDLTYGMERTCESEDLVETV